MRVLKTIQLQHDLASNGAGRAGWRKANFMNQSTRSYRRARRALLVLSTGTMMQVIPFGCGQPILRAVTPILLDDTNNILDMVLRVIAPLLLP